MLLLCVPLIQVSFFIVLNIFIKGLSLWYADHVPTLYKIVYNTMFLHNILSMYVTLKK